MIKITKENQAHLKKMTLHETHEMYGNVIISTRDVWNYKAATPELLSSLNRQMMIERAAEKMRNVKTLILAIGLGLIFTALLPKFFDFYL